MGSVVEEPPSRVGGRKRRVDELTREEVESAWELMEMRRKAYAEREEQQPQQHPIQKEPDPQPIKAARPVMVRVPGAQPSRAVIPEGTTIDRAQSLALLIALSELDD